MNARPPTTPRPPQGASPNPGALGPAPVPASEDDRGPPIWLIPVGGLGNRIRFVSSAAQACQGRPLRLLDVRTNMFAGRLEDFVELPPEMRVRRASFRSEKVLIQLLKTLTPLASLSGGRVAPYGTKAIPPGCRVAASFTVVTGMSQAFLPLRPVPPAVAFPYDAVHIRGTDNALAISLNRPEGFERFIEAASRPVYVASDSDATKQALRARFGDKVFFREVGLRRDSEDDLRAAFEELWCLIRSVRFLGSKGSSFSTLAKVHRAERGPSRS